MGSGGRSGGGFGGGRSSGGFKSGSSSRSSGSSSRSSGSSSGSSGHKSNNSSSTSTNTPIQPSQPSHSNKHTNTNKNPNVKTTPTLNNPTKTVQKSGSLSPVAVAGLAGLSAILIGRQINRAHRDQQTNNVEYNQQVNNVEYNQQVNNVEYNQQINNVEYIQQGLADCYICSNNNTRDSLSDFEFTTSSFEKMQDCVTRYNEDNNSISDTLCINFIQCLKERNIID